MPWCGHPRPELVFSQCWCQVALGSSVGEHAVFALGRCFCPFPGGPEELWVGPGPWGTPGLLQAAFDLAKPFQHPTRLPGSLTVMSWCVPSCGPELLGG